MLKTKKKIISSRGDKKNIFKERLFRDFILILIFFSSLSWLVLGTSIFEIKKIKVSSPKKIEKGIEGMASKEKNFFLFNKAKVSQEIKKEYPQIKEISVKKEFPSTIILKAKAGRAVGFFCIEGKGKQCFLISEEGVLLKKSNPKKGSLVFFDHNLKNTESGEIVVPKKLFYNIMFLIKELRKIKINPEKIEFYPFEIIIKTNKDLKIYFLKNNFRAQVEVFLNIYKKTINQKEKKNLEYMDFRSLEDGKKGAVYWK